MNSDTTFIKTITISPEYRKGLTDILLDCYYDELRIFSNKVMGYSEGQHKMTWYFNDYIGILVRKADTSGHVAHLVFATGTSFDFKIELSCGAFGKNEISNYANSLASEIREIYEAYRNTIESNRTAGIISVADEIKKFNDLLDLGVITQEEFDSKKAQLLSL